MFYSLCTPAKAYLIIAFIALITTMIYNSYIKTEQNILCLGNVKCPVGNKISFFSMNILFMILWTWILNFICMNGYPNFAWFLFLLPFILFLSLIFFIFYIISFFK